MRKVFCIYLLLGVVICSKSQVIYGINNYTEYHVGTLPIVISVPHGGLVAPSNIPDRTCNSAVNDLDMNTIELGKQIDSSFFASTGCHPHLIYCNLKRSKVDCNRNVSDGACGNQNAISAWTNFHHFIDTAQQLAQTQYGGKAFYIDLHGHGHTVQQLELGYLLYGSELGYTDSVLNSTQYIGYSSIQNLVANNVHNYQHATLLRGNYALGTLLANAGYPSVPSLQTPSPGSNPYFEGGYNTANYTSYAIGKTVNGLQIECNFTNVRDSYLSRKKFADSLANILITYLNFHQNINVNNCSGSLPIKLTNFNGSSNNCSITLVWQTTNEQINKGFDIERSDDGKSFTAITFKESKGFVATYTFNDFNPMVGKNFYRLKQIDMNGKTTFSKIISINNVCESSKINVYPNPVKNYLSITKDNNNSSSIKISNIYGSIIKQWINTNITSLDISTLNSGTYILTIDTKNIKFVKE